MQSIRASAPQIRAAALRGPARNTARRLSAPSGGGTGERIRPDLKRARGGREGGIVDSLLRGALGGGLGPLGGLAQLDDLQVVLAVHVAKE